MVSETETEGKSATPVTFLPIEPGFPDAQIPTFFADGVSNFATIYGTVRFYLARQYPENIGGGTYKNQPFAQVIMPVSAFVQMTTFFEKALKHFATNGTISLDVINAARALEKAEPWSAEATSA